MFLKLFVTFDTDLALFFDSNDTAIEDQHYYLNIAYQRSGIFLIHNANIDMIIELNTRYLKFLNLSILFSYR